MKLSGQAKLLRIFTGEMDKVNHVPLYEAIIREARAAGLAGATAWRGMMGFGPTSRIRSAKILDISADLPVIVEIVDEEAKIDAFRTKLSELFDAANSGGLVTMEKVEILRYVHGVDEDREKQTR
jgi:uncharacterized protein